MEFREDLKPQETHWGGSNNSRIGIGPEPRRACCPSLMEVAVKMFF